MSELRRCLLAWRRAGVRTRAVCSVWSFTANHHKQGTQHCLICPALASFLAGVCCFLSGDSVLWQMGACERIVKSSVPTSYSRHTSRFLSMWCFTLPLVLVHSLKWKMIPAVAIMCWMLFIIEEVTFSPKHRTI